MWVLDTGWEDDKQASSGKILFDDEGSHDRFKYSGVDCGESFRKYPDGLSHSGEDLAIILYLRTLAQIRPGFHCKILIYFS